jgi:hypothetical protein
MELSFVLCWVLEKMRTADQRQSGSERLAFAMMTDWVFEDSWQNSFALMHSMKRASLKGISASGERW